MLANRRQAAGRKRESILFERWKLVPFFRRVAEDPFDLSCFVIETDKEIFPTGNDEGVIGAIVCGAVVMEPISRCRINKLAGIVSARDHGCANDVGQVPRL